MLLCRYVTVALAIAHYYWTRGNREVMPRFPVLHAIRTTLRCAVLCHTVPQTCSKAFFYTITARISSMC